ncbi:SNF2-related protein [Rosistilla oblonga]|uniref:SNF2-related protein n=1 Tax=Rosistilla oblonga TaxID=2527990 RepID=UPI003A96D19F
MRSDAAAYAIQQKRADRILSSTHKPPKINFRKGTSPRGYQTQAAELLWQVKGLLCADELGLGKTVTGIAALTNPDLRPGVVVAQTHLTFQWAKQIETFLPEARTHTLRTNKHYEIPRQRRCEKCGVWTEQTIRAGRILREVRCKVCGDYINRGPLLPPELFVLNYQKLDSWSGWLSQQSKSIIFDECQELRRNESKKWEAAKRIADRCEYRLGLSATPTYNLGGEAFNVMECLTPGKLDTKSIFRQTWCESYYEGREPSLKDPAAFGQYMREQNMMIRRSREDVGREMPSHTKIVHPIEADESAIDSVRGKAGELARAALTEGGRGIDIMQASAQLENLLRQQTGIAKAPFVASFVDYLIEQGEPVVLFGWHRDVYEIWCQKLKDHRPLLYTGSESPDKKRENAQRFIQGESNLLIVSLRSGAGLDGLQHRACTGVFGELDWSPQVHKQCWGRYHRDGQKRPCLTYFLLSDYGLDPYMAETLQLKSHQSDQILAVDSRNENKVIAQSKKALKDLARKYAT